MTQLSKSFSLQEATVSQTAAREGIDNTPSQSILQNMIFAATKLQLVRDYLDEPLRVTSWYRCPELNKAVGGAADSAHMYGYAIDCHVDSTSPYLLCLKVYEFLRKSGIPFDQMIHEFGTWMHISFDPKGREQTLTIFHPERKYVPGLLSQEQYKDAV